MTITIDDLNAPLKPVEVRKKKVNSRLVVNALAGILVVFGLSMLGWIVLAGDPHGGEPVATLELTEPERPTPNAQLKNGQENFPFDQQLSQNGESEGEFSSELQNQELDNLNSDIGDDSQLAVNQQPASQLQIGRRGVAIVHQASDRKIPIGSLSVAPNPSLVEKTPFGQIPKIGANGLRAAEAYARPSPVSYSQSSGGQPRIAIMVTGMGISSRATENAILTLPGEMSFAFAPYGRDLRSWVKKARSSGHEVLLQIPMEPFDYPSNDPGPHTLRVGTSGNLDNLRWLMARFPGYVGITNYMGAKFTASAEAFAPILQEAAKRGLGYVDDASSPRSVFSRLSRQVGISGVGADVVIDAGRTSENIDVALQRLEQIARARGSALGVASGLPLTVKKLKEWSNRLEAKGIILTPVSSLFKNPQQS